MDDLVSPEIFRNYPIATYRSHMARAFKEWLVSNHQVVSTASTYSCSSSNDKMIRFRASLFSADDNKHLDANSSSVSATKAINWGKLFENHDHTKKAQRPSSSSSPTTIVVKGETILEILLETIRNPTVCPVVCWPFVCQELLFTTIIHGNEKNCTKQWQESQKLVIAYITDLLHHHACLRPTVLVTFVSSQKLFNGYCSSRIDHVQNVSRIIQHWLGEFPQYRTDLLQSFLRLCDLLEEMEKKTTRQQQTKPVQQQRIVDDTRIITPTKRSSLFNLAHLHGELSETEEMQLLNRVCRRYQYYSKTRRNSHQRLPLGDARNNNQRRTDECTEIILEAWRLQAKYIGRIFLSNARRASYAWTRTWTTLPRKTVEASEATIANVITHENPKSPLRRLCSILWVTEKAEDGKSQYARFDALLRVLWSKASSSLVDDLQHCCVYLSWYTEIVIECSFFDNIDNLWHALLPWLEFLTEQHRLHQDRKCLRPYLKGLAIVLAHRGRFLHASQKCGSVYRVMMSRLALCYDHPDDWLDSNEQNYEKYMQALQMAGIVGVLNVEIDPYASNTTLINTPPGTLDSPSFETSFYVRYKLDQLRPWLPKSIQTSQFLSDYSPVNGVPPIQLDSSRVGSHREQIKCPKTTSAYVNFLDDVNDDILFLMFQFLNHHQVSKMRLVCSKWRQNADSNKLWQSLYISIHGSRLQVDDPMLSTQSPLNWKQLFVDQYMVERDVGFRVCSTDPHWKVRVCGYIGCLNVLTTPSACNRHYQKHRRENLKTSGPTQRSQNRQKRQLNTNHPLTYTKNRQIRMKKVDDTSMENNCRSGIRNRNTR
jgi:hypothetical protein